LPHNFSKNTAGNPTADSVAGVAQSARFDAKKARAILLHPFCQLVFPKLILKEGGCCLE
jgi:hypothetical protein